jgi:hypothetical protein
MANLISLFVDRAAVDIRDGEVTAANWGNGGNAAASNAPGIGITSPLTNLPAFTTVTGPNWSLLDQFSVARTPQVSQVIGGEGVTTSADWPGSGGISGNGSAHGEEVNFATMPADVSGVPDPTYPAPTVTGNATLTTLAAGWVNV